MMRHPKRLLIAPALAAAAILIVGCRQTPTAPLASRAAVRAVGAGGRAAESSPAAGALPSGERRHGQLVSEPAYDFLTGDLIFMQAKGGVQPAHADARTVGVLYIVEYPTGASVPTLNCVGVPGNCPDHDPLFAQVAQQTMPGVYGTFDAEHPDVGILGHDHLVSGHDGHGSYDVAREVHEVLFTSAEAAANSHLTTQSAIEAAVEAGDAVDLDLGLAIHLVVVSQSAYETGAPVVGG
ncbi:MAG TPA: hypothetical protein VKB18_05440 [Gemmatimonadota bacterium]|nr:hypothetical protein [Gemmatimonadota bacterium]